MYGVDGGICPSFQGNPWTKAEDSIGPLWAVCAKEEGTVGILGILVTTSPEAPARIMGTDGWTTQLAAVNGIVGMLYLGALTGGGSTPSTRMDKVNTKELSSTEDIILPTGTPKISESKGLTSNITGSFKSVKGVLKFLGNSSAYKSSISTVLKSEWLALSVGSPRTSLTRIGSNESSVSNLHL